MLGELRRADLNLLVAFDALMREQHVTRAGLRIGLSQPAMSNALGRLRELFGDPLLVRVPSGMQPTPRARALTEPVRDALAQLASALSPLATFDPGAGSRVFRIGTVDYLTSTLISALLARLRIDGIEVGLRVLSATRLTAPSMLDDESIELAIGAFYPDSARFVREVIFEEGFCCFVWRDNPAVSEGLSLAQYIASPHLLVSMDGSDSGWVDSELGRLGLSRRVVATVPHFVAAAAVLVGSEMIATLPRSMARMFESLGVPLRAFEPPLTLPTFSVTQVWHRVRHEDPGLVWLRGLIRSLSRTGL